MGNKKQKIIAVVAILIVFIICGITYLDMSIDKNNKEHTYTMEVKGVKNEEEIKLGEEVEAVTLKEKEEEKKKIMLRVHIAGAVKNQQVVTIEEGSILQDAIELAGGLNEDASLEAINLATLLKDNQKYYIPHESDSEEKISQLLHQDMKVINDDGLININTASTIELESLNGVGEATAKGIVAHRNEKGLFKTIEDIMKVSGIKQATFNKFKDQIKVE